MRLPNRVEMPMGRSFFKLSVLRYPHCWKRLPRKKKQRQRIKPNNLINTRDPEYSFNPSSKRAFLKEMLRQKRVEFWGEGIVFFDYKRLDFGFARGYEGSNHAPVYMYNCHGRSPQWNLVITRTESQSNSAIDEDNNNPDPSNLIKLWPSEWKDAEWVDD